MIGVVSGVAGQPVRVRGYAQDFDFPVSAVEFSCDDGRTWTAYETPEADTDCNVNWSFTFEPPEAGTYVLLVRAVRADGQASLEPARVTVEVEPAP